MASTSSSPDKAVQLNDDEVDLLFEVPPPPPSYQQTVSTSSGSAPAYTPHVQRNLSKPIALPQIALSSDSPFVRAYAPELERCDVSMSKWLEFLDGLTYVMIASPPLQALDMQGRFVVISPISWIKLAGTAARLPQQMLSQSKSNKYLERANSGYFAPRGLRVRFMKTKALRAFLDLVEGNGTGTGKGKKPSIMSKIGKGAEKTVMTVRLPIISGIADSILDAVKPLPQASTSISAAAGGGITSNTPESSGLSDIAFRRLGEFSDRIAVLNVDVPNPTPPAQTTLSTRSNALAVRMHAANARQREGYRRATGEDANTYQQGLERRREEMNKEDAVWLVVLTLEQDALLVGAQAASSATGNVGIPTAQEVEGTRPPEKA